MTRVPFGTEVGTKPNFLDQNSVNLRMKTVDDLITLIVLGQPQGV